MEELDLHGFTVAEAEEVFFKYLDEVRLLKKDKEVSFITGVGKIQRRFQELATQNQISFYIPMANSGVIIVHFE